MLIKPFFRKPAISMMQEKLLLARLQKEVSPDIVSIKSELKYNIDSSRPLNSTESENLKWLLAKTYEKENFGEESFLGNGNTLEVGTRLDRVTPWSSNAVSISQACQIDSITRLETSRRYQLVLRAGTVLNEEQKKKVYLLVHDRMTEEPYLQPLVTFETERKPEPVYIVPLIEEGKDALRKINEEMGLGMDEWDINYYYDLFVNVFKRNPTNVECFQLGQANSEHSRHWFFKGRQVIDGQEMSYSLLEIVQQPYRVNPNNSLIAFSAGKRLNT
jgi:phosphoribosylformylglycinamidine synthase